MNITVHEMLKRLEDAELVNDDLPPLLQWLKDICIDSRNQMSEEEASLAHKVVDLVMFFTQNNAAKEASMIQASSVVEDTMFASMLFTTITLFMAGSKNISVKLPPTPPHKEN